MKGRKTYGPRFTILQRAQLLENTKIQPIDRKDRYFIDNWKLETLWTSEGFRKNFIARVGLVQNLLKIPHLALEQDLLSKRSVFVPKRLHMGVNSLYLYQYAENANRLEKLIYVNFLVPFNWSYNFYPFIEYFILYGKRTNISITPNPKQLELILSKHKELGRNSYTKSDIKFLLQQVRLILGAANIRSTKRMTEKVHAIEPILQAKLSDERPPRNPVLKILCFDIYNYMPTDAKDYLSDDEKKYDQFLKAQVPNLVDSYNDFFERETESKYKKPLSDKQAYLALRRYYSEYKKISFL